MPNGDVGSPNRLAGVGREHEPCKLAIPTPGDQSQIAYPYGRERNDVLFFTKLWVVTRGNEIETGFEFVGSGKHCGSFLVVSSHGQLLGPLQRRRLPKDFAAFGISQVFG